MPINRSRIDITDHRSIMREYLDQPIVHCYHAHDPYTVFAPAVARQMRRAIAQSMDVAFASLFSGAIPSRTPRKEPSMGLNSSSPTSASQNPASPAPTSAAEIVLANLNQVPFDLKASELPGVISLVQKGIAEGQRRAAAELEQLRAKIADARTRLGY